MQSSKLDKAYRSATIEILIDVIRTHLFIMLHGKMYENKYFYAAPEYSAGLLNRFKAEDYDVILSIIEEGKPEAIGKISH